MNQTAVVMTVYNRPLIVLLNTFSALRRALPAAQVIVVDDASTTLPNLESVCHDFAFTYTRCDTIAECPGTYNIDGYNNPSHAFNVGIEAAKDCHELVIMSSDIIVQSKVGEMLKVYSEEKLLDKAVWMPTIIDMDSGAPYLSPMCHWPMPWFCMTLKRHVDAIGRYDERYLKGIAFEDNDFSGRLLSHVGGLVIDGNVLAYHQSHPQTAYSDKGRGWTTNENYTREKWGGVPFRPQDQCVVLEPSEKGDNVIAFNVRSNYRNIAEVMQFGGGA